ncbi:MAG: sulfotransferase, partial [Methyloceanibacter sp.]|nr:sulfotransferase [Methyloceanibacter sp.]
MAKLVYIGGYGRSGSTLLEYLLAANPKVVACGEIARHLRSFGRHKICTCGEPMKVCPVWGDFRHKSGRLKGLDHEDLGRALLEHVSGQYAVMVDSSKTAWGSTLMPFRMSKRLGRDFLLVHLVRDPRGVCWSTMRAQQRPKKTPKKGKVKLWQKSRRGSPPAIRSIRTVIGWTIANLACEMFGWRHPDRYVRIRYEDLVQAPLEAITQVLARVSLDPPSTLERNYLADNRHQLYGNAMR